MFGMDLGYFTDLSVLDARRATDNIQVNTLGILTICKSSNLMDRHADKVSPL